MGSALPADRARPPTRDAHATPWRRADGGMRARVASSRSRPTAHQEVPMPLLDLTPDELLSTTRAVRRRLDLSRPVPDELLEECVRLAVQAPTSTNTQNWHFLIVTDEAERQALAELYLRSWIPYNGGAAARGIDCRHGVASPRSAPARGPRARDPVHHRTARGTCAGGSRLVLRVHHPGRLELPARSPGTRPRQRLDDPPPRLRARGGRRCSASRSTRSPRSR